MRGSIVHDGEFHWPGRASSCAIIAAQRITERPAMQNTYNRAAEDIGNIVHLEHVNVTIPDQRIASLFYVAGLGLTRDPYLMVSDTNMWVNVGRSQFHLPQGDAQVLRGVTGIVMQGRTELLARLNKVHDKLANTSFSFKASETFVEATCPWGNRVRVHEPDAERYGRIQLGMPYVEFDVPIGTAKGIGSFYRSVIGAPSRPINGDGAGVAVQVGKAQQFIFRETERSLPAFDQHHVQIYVADFSGPHRRLAERNLIHSEDNQYQYRFRDIVDPESGRHLFTVEHEVRSITHPLFMRPLINRNPMLSNGNYSAGYDATPWAMAPDTFDGA
jgi:hypothetical protein